MKSKYFFCYDREMKIYILKHEHVILITHANHPRTKRPFWLFEMDEHLDMLIKNYVKLKQSKVNEIG